jgi:hypothetical protein
MVKNFQEPSSLTVTNKGAAYDQEKGTLHLLKKLQHEKSPTTICHD